jgi:hypothetical protein
MDVNNSHRLVREIPDDALVLDVGGGAAPFPRADWVIDALPFEALGGGSHGNIHAALAQVPRRYAAERWVRHDLCARAPWPFADGQFDFAVCSHLLEDIRDPIWVCSELRRVARAGYIETPSRILEQSRGVENPRHCGYYHHRWLVDRAPSGDGLVFRHKPHCLHSFRDAWVTRLGPTQRIADRHAVVWLDWRAGFPAEEVLEFSERAVIDELCAFAAGARRTEGLIEDIPMSRADRLRRRIYYTRLAAGFP